MRRREHFSEHFLFRTRYHQLMAPSFDSEDSYSWCFSSTSDLSGDLSGMKSERIFSQMEKVVGKIFASKSEREREGVREERK